MVYTLKFICKYHMPLLELSIRYPWSATSTPIHYQPVICYLVFWVLPFVFWAWRRWRWRRYMLFYWSSSFSSLFSSFNYRFNTVLFPYGKSGSMDAELLTNKLSELIGNVLCMNAGRTFSLCYSIGHITYLINRTM